MIFDSDLDITWYDYTNSQDDWFNQMAWADGLSVNFGGNVIDNWRLPTTVDGYFEWDDPYSDGFDGTTTGGYNVTSSEMGHLFYTELGNSGALDTSGNPTGCWQSPDWQPCLTNTGDFQNLQATQYWSGTVYSISPAYAWIFDTRYGYQFFRQMYKPNASGIAVMDGMAVVPEPMISIDIDIKPGSYPNIINLRSKGVIPVAILTTGDFDATTVDPSTVVFGPNKTVGVHGKCRIKDVDKDGDLDLILHFKTEETGIACGDTEAGLTGETFDGQEIEGFDSIHIIRCK